MQITKTELSVRIWSIKKKLCHLKPSYPITGKPSTTECSTTYFWPTNISICSCRWPGDIGVTEPLFESETLDRRLPTGTLALGFFQHLLVNNRKNSSIFTYRKFPILRTFKSWVIMRPVAIEYFQGGGRACLRLIGASNS